MSEHKKLIENLEKDWSLSGIERALGLPFKTLTKMKTHKRVSASTLGLLKILNQFPWMIDVADNNYEENYAKKTHLHAAVEVMFPDEKPLKTPNN